MKHIIPILICSVFIFDNAKAQYEEDRLFPELSVGMKAVAGEFEYGPKYFQTTSFVPGFQPTVRFDFPIHLFTIRERPFYISLTASTGLLIVPNKKRIHQDYDPNTGQFTEYPSKSPLYMPFYFGFYDPGPFGVGVEAFYAKGLNGISDIWGMKLLGLSYNHSKFRIDAGYEIAVPVKFNPDNPSYFFSLDFLWKLNSRQE